jgi:hypothetical protein
MHLARINMRLLGLTGLTLILTASSSYANTITVTQTGVGSGMIGSTSFTDAAFTITEIGDTSDVTPFTEGEFFADTSASITISGVGTLDFTSPTSTFVNNDLDEVGFGRPSRDLYEGPENAAFATWNMLSSIGPISGSAELLQWKLSPVDTSGGVLVFNRGLSDTVFTATVSAVPEPWTFPLLGIGLAGMLIFTTRRKRLPSRG